MVRVGLCYSFFGLLFLIVFSMEILEFVLGVGNDLKRRRGRDFSCEYGIVVGFVWVVGAIGRGGVGGGS